MYTWVNSRLHDSVSVFDRGLAFGDGVFETMRVSSGAIPALDFHLQRLVAGAKRLALSIDLEEVRSDISTALLQISTQSIHTWRLKYIVTRGESNSGYSPNPKGTPNRILVLNIYDSGFSRLLQQQGVKTCTCQWRLSDQPRLAGIKHLNRLDQVMGRLECSDRDCYEGLMLDQDGHYIEGTMTNLFAVTQDGEVITPRLEMAGVEGVMRKIVVDHLCADINKPCYEAEIIRMDEFAEVFITNVLLGIVPVIAVDHVKFGIGPVTRSLQHALAKSGWIS